MVLGSLFFDSFYKGFVLENYPPKSKILDSTGIEGGVNSFQQAATLHFSTQKSMNRENVKFFIC